jgi:hypothetical protein
MMRGGEKLMIRNYRGGLLQNVVIHSSKKRNNKKKINNRSIN